MKKIVIVMAMAAIALGATAAKKDKKKAAADAVEAAPVEQKALVNLQTPADSVNYAAGQSFTQGLSQYVKGQLGVSDENMPFFIEGLKKGLALGDDPQTKARAAGEQIASMVRDRMVPGLKSELEGTSVTPDAELFKRGFIDAVEKDASVLSVEEAAKYYQQKATQLKNEKEAAQKAEGQAYLDANAKKPGVVTLPSGLQYKVLKEGHGPVATKDQEVVVKYEGKLIDGTVFDSSYKRNPDTSSFKPTQVIAGWTEALTMMPQGSEWELYIPYNLAYGERGSNGHIPPFATLIFKVEVVEVKAPAEAAPAPVKAEPAAQTAAPAKKVAAKTPAKKAPAKKK